MTVCCLHTQFLFGAIDGVFVLVENVCDQSIFGISMGRNPCIMKLTAMTREMMIKHDLFRVEGG